MKQNLSISQGLKEKKFIRVSDDVLVLYNN